jgi:transcriptional regulator with XRE-family HTH domain
MRIARGLTHKQVADAVGVSVNTIQRVESGEHPTLKNALAIAKFYGITVEKLVDQMAVQTALPLPEPNHEEHLVLTTGPGEIVGDLLAPGAEVMTLTSNGGAESEAEPEEEPVSTKNEPDYDPKVGF